MPGLPSGPQLGAWPATPRAARLGYSSPRRRVDRPRAGAPQRRPARRVAGHAPHGQAQVPVPATEGSTEAPLGSRPRGRWPTTPTPAALPRGHAQRRPARRAPRVSAPGPSCRNAPLRWPRPASLPPAALVRVPRWVESARGNTPPTTVARRRGGRGEGGRGAKGNCAGLEPGSPLSLPPRSPLHHGCSYPSPLRGRAHGGKLGANGGSTAVHGRRRPLAPTAPGHPPCGGLPGSLRDGGRQGPATQLGPKRALFGSPPDSGRRAPSTALRVFPGGMSSTAGHGHTRAIVRRPVELNPALWVVDGCRLTAPGGGPASDLSRAVGELPRGSPASLEASRIRS